MVKKLKALAGAGDKQFAQTVKDSAQQIWLAGLGAFALLSRLRPLETRS